MRPAETAGRIKFYRLKIFQKFDDVAYSFQFGNLVLGNGFARVVLERHQKLDHIKRVRAEILYNFVLGPNFFLRYIQLLGKSLYYFFKHFNFLQRYFLIELYYKCVFFVKYKKLISLFFYLF